MSDTDSIHESLLRFKRMFGEDFMENYPLESLKEAMGLGLKRLFKTGTAQTIARRLTKESGLLTDKKIDAILVN